MIACQRRLQRAIWANLGRQVVNLAANNTDRSGMSRRLLIAVGSCGIEAGVLVTSGAGRTGWRWLELVVRGLARELAEIRLVSMDQWNQYSGGVMSTTQVVWREMLAAARVGRRRWPSVSGLAGELGVPVSTAHRSLAHPVEIGAAEVSPMEGLVLLDPYRLLLLLAAHRHLQRDIVGHLRLSAPVAQVEAAIHAQPACVLGAFSAAAAHAGDNRVADYDTILVYGTPALESFEPAGTGGGTEVLIADGDPWVGRHGRITTYAQAWADLFCLPGWQAARFVDQLDPKEVAGRNEPVLLL